MSLNGKRHCSDRAKTDTQRYGWHGIVIQTSCNDW